MLGVDCGGFVGVIGHWAEDGQPAFADESEADLVRKIRESLDTAEEDALCEETHEFVSPTLRPLLAPERERLQCGMTEAIQSMLRLVYD